MAAHAGWLIIWGGDEVVTPDPVIGCIDAAGIYQSGAQSAAVYNGVAVSDVYSARRTGGTYQGGLRMADTYQSGVVAAQAGCS